MAKKKTISDAKKQKIYDDLIRGVSYYNVAIKHKLSLGMHTR